MSKESYPAGCNLAVAVSGCAEEEGEPWSLHHAKAERILAVAPRPKPRARRGAGKLPDRDDRDVAIALARPRAV